VKILSRVLLPGDGPVGDLTTWPSYSMTTTTTNGGTTSTEASTATTGGSTTTSEDSTTAEESTTTTAPFTGTPTFSDVSESHPQHDAIVGLAAEGVISGFEDGTFGPGLAVTRQQFAKMIVKTLGYPVTGEEVCPFTDVQAQAGADPFYPSKYVAVCAAHDITKGVTPQHFNPTANITRQQLITMIVRAAALPDAPPGFLPNFTAAQFSLEEHYLNAVKAAGAGLLDGLQGIAPTYDFLSPATRGECAQVLYNLWKM
jgi:hypothetical protein